MHLFTNLPLELQFLFLRTQYNTNSSHYMNFSNYKYNSAQLNKRRNMLKQYIRANCDLHRELFYAETKVQLAESLKFTTTQIKITD